MICPHSPPLSPSSMVKALEFGRWLWFDTITFFHKESLHKGNATTTLKANQHFLTTKSPTPSPPQAFWPLDHLRSNQWH